MVSEPVKLLAINLNHYTDPIIPKWRAKNTIIIETTRQVNKNNNKTGHNNF